MFVLHHFISGRGRDIIIDFISKQSEDVQEKIFELLNDFEVYGFHLETKYLRRISGTKRLWELRLSYWTGQYRFLIAKRGKNEAVILSAFIKKSQSTPIKEIKKAEKRLKTLI